MLLGCQMEVLVELTETPFLKREGEVGGKNWELCGLAVQEVYCGNEVKHVSGCSLTLCAEQVHVTFQSKHLSCYTLALI